MIQLVVVFRLNDQATEERVASFRRELDVLTAETASLGVIECHAGGQTAGSDRMGDFGIAALFDDEDALRAWIEHPHHRDITRDYTRVLVAESHSVQFVVDA